MKAKLTIIKASAEGEQVSIEGEIDTKELRAAGKFSKEGLREECDPFFGLIDDRLREMNERVIASNHLIKNLSAEAQMAIHQAIDMLYGRAPREEVHKIYEDVRKEAEANAEKAYQAGHKGGRSGNGQGPVGNA